MSTFGIRISEFASRDDHFVSDDAVLFDWLVASNYEPSEQSDCYTVQAPDGYAFWSGNLILKNSPKLENVDESELSTSSTVTSGSAENDKARMLLKEAMSYMKPASFYALGISEDRIRLLKLPLKKRNHYDSVWD